MKILRRIIVAVAVMLLLFMGSYKVFNNAQETKEEVMLQMAIGALNSAHYNPLAINDTFSDHAYKLYVQRLDFSKKFLLKEDMDKLDEYRYKIDEQINENKFDFFELSNKIITQRIKESEAYYKEALQKPFDFSQDENIELDGEKIPLCRTKDEMKDAWRKAMKYQVMGRVADMMENQERAKERKDSLAKVNSSRGPDYKEKAKEKKDSVVKEKTFPEMEKEAREKVLKSNEDWFRRLNQLKREDRINAYINAIVSVYDPHTEFFPPKEKKNFDISMTGQLEGIGAQLVEREGQIRVMNIVPGSASWKQGQLKAGDIILKVAQGSNDPVDVSGMRIDDVVLLIRGKKGTEVRLSVKKADGNIVDITIIRDIVIIEETYAQSAIIKRDKKAGYIRLPSFYGDLNGQGTRSSSEDIKKELIKLNNEKVDGIILDLRDNGGGSLQDVVKMVGYFIRTGPVVQVKAKDAKANILGDYDTTIVYRGPLVVMVNGNSASASEILAAAIQDHKRGIIVGSNSTFGKGTVQRFISLDDYVMQAFDKYKPIGDVKLTIQKFYRINGTTTQLKGVVPDIILPDWFSSVDGGEKELEFPMPWDNISPVEYSTWNHIDMQKIKMKSEKRLEEDPLFKLAKEQSEYYKLQRDDTQSTLNLEKYRLELKQIREKTKKYEAIAQEIKGMEVMNIAEDGKIIQADSTKSARNKEWFKNIRKDIYINEALLISGDLKK